MRTTGITRRIDSLGRVVIPKELRKNIHLKEGDQLEIYITDDEEIVLKKYNRLGENKVFIEVFLSSVKSLLGCDIYILTNEDVLFSTSNSNLSILDESKSLKSFEIIPNGDFIGKLIFDFHGKEINRENLNLIKNLALIFQGFFEE